MSARNSEDKRVLEMERAIREAKSRVDELGLTRESFSNPQTTRDAAIVDGVLFAVYRAVERASNLSFETKRMAEDVPWDQVSGLRNRLAHDYPGVNDAVVWDVIHHDFDTLLRLCDDYWVARGLDVGERPIRAV